MPVTVSKRRSYLPTDTTEMEQRAWRWSLSVRGFNLDTEIARHSTTRHDTTRYAFDYSRGKSLASSIKTVGGKWYQQRRPSGAGWFGWLRISSRVLVFHTDDLAAHALARVRAREKERERPHGCGTHGQAGDHAGRQLSFRPVRGEDPAGRRVRSSTVGTYGLYGTASTPQFVAYATAPHHLCAASHVHLIGLGAACTHACLRQTPGPASEDEGVYLRQHCFLVGWAGESCVPTERAPAPAPHTCVLRSGQGDDGSGWLVALFGAFPSGDVQDFGGEVYVTAGRPAAM
ncbi:hypothetical protein PMIN01_02657 [Paraphaeosphaeria minitans]|uniref:Uncharacterized protein n=1 Tax=Paraphaeosphaeria minitans TaxID=565426 RepID=A0A9P6GQJ5_9PLEO|nr:hypothetical protein PMIN01_02657 [Paraphaeosphaeria minitans]